MNRTFTSFSVRSRSITSQARGSYSRKLVHRGIVGANLMDSCSTFTEDTASLSRSRSSTLQKLGGKFASCTSQSCDILCQAGDSQRWKSASISTRTRASLSVLSLWRNSIKFRQGISASCRSPEDNQLSNIVPPQAVAGHPSSSSVQAHRSHCGPPSLGRW